MTEDAIKQFVKALAIIAVAVGGFGSILCVPYALTTNLVLITTAGIYFVAGGVMITGGLVALSLLMQPGK
ncbi:MAG: hypothetical protein AB7S78_09025 [Candidatus Omnitrophota bacterium]